MKLPTLAAAILIVLLPAGAAAQDPATDIIVEDVHGRVLNGRAITLFDWDGFIANPAVKLFVRAPLNVGFPATANLSATEPRLYFDLPSQFGPGGPGKSLTLPGSAPVPFHLSIFPDRNGTSETHTLTIAIQEQTLTLDIHVIDQDLSLPPLFNVTVDFTRDQTGFFSSNQQRRAIVQQATADWAYFIADMDLDQVPAGGETTFIWNPDGFNSGSFTTNAQPYTGFLLYAYGIHSAALRSGGEPSLHAFQHSGPVQLPLRRSGGVELETEGNFNTLGWLLTAGESDWWDATNLAGEPNDLYSIAHHEFGHALFCNPGYPNFTRDGTLGSAAITAYHGSSLAIDGHDHFDESVDRSSLKGAFGYEYHGDVPAGRWLPTKLDLLALEAVGYELRDLSLFSKPVITTTIDAEGSVGTPFSAAMQANGGVPAYDWTVTAGTLPPGLTLDRFTGVISGTPTQAGTFSFTVRVRDSDALLSSDTADASIEITAPLPPPASIVAQATGSTSVHVSWSAVGGASQYEVFRSASGHAFSSIGTTAATSFTDLTVLPDNAYLYKVRATGGAFSGVDLATTVLFSDDPVVVHVTKIKAAHLTELRRAVNAVRALAGLPAAAFTDATLPGKRVRAVHISELRTNLNAARSALSLSASVFTHSTIVRAAHVTELRSGVR
jgi:Putative Ig domain